MNAIEKLNESLKYNSSTNNRNVVSAVCVQELKNMLNYTTTYAEKKFLEQLIDQCNRQVYSNTPMKLSQVNDIVSTYKKYVGTIIKTDDVSCVNCIPKDGSITIDKLAKETVEFIETRGGFQKNAVSPILKVTWQNNRTNDITNELNTIAEIGDTYTWRGSYSWNSSDYAAEPVSIESNVFTTLTEDGVQSNVIEERVSYNETFNITLVASNLEKATATSSITFKHPSYYGIVNKSLTKVLSSSPSLTVANVTTKKDEYFVYKYSNVLPKVTSITMNDTFNVTQAFNYSEESFTTDTGKNIILRVYTSANPGAFTNAKLNFK